MKMMLLAAVAVLATPAFAQSGSMPQSGSNMPDSATPATPADTMGNQAGDPVGGYQPSAPPMSGPVQPGTIVHFQQAPTPDQAYPAPPPMAHYPMCKPGQFDNCMQGPGSTHSRQVHGRGR